MPASWSNSTPRLNKWSSEPEKAHFSWRLVSTPPVSYERGRHLDVSPPPSPTELESASRRYNLVCGCPAAFNGASTASTTFVNVRGESARPKGRTRYWYALPPKANLRNFL